MRSAIDLAREKLLITEWKGVEDWRNRQKVLRSYKEEVVARINKIAASGQFTLQQYGALSHKPDRYPLFALQSSILRPDNDNILLTGGVHGYETSGVQGTLDFLEKYAHHYKDHFNFVAAPDVSPWGYETNNRLNFNAQNPNREAFLGTTCEEAYKLITYLASLGIPFHYHNDAHETTDTDETVYRREAALMAGEKFKPGTIPDGFYLVVPEADERPELHNAIITSVESITHIAPSENGTIIGLPETQRGVAAYPGGNGLFMDMTRASKHHGAVTTEIYPNSEGTTPEECNLGQVACIVGALNHILREKGIEPPEFDLAA